MAKITNNANSFDIEGNLSVSGEITAEDLKDLNGNDLIIFKPMSTPSGSTLTTEQYDELTNGENHIIRNYTLFGNDCLFVILFGCKQNGVLFEGTYYSKGTYIGQFGTYRIDTRNYKISSLENNVVFGSNYVDITKLRRINLKDFPAYPSSPTVDKVLTYNTDDTLSWKEISQSEESDPIYSASAAATITSQDITTWNNKSDFSGNYNDLSNKPTIPTISGTNDGTNWTTITINGTTKNIPSGGGGEPDAYIKSASTSGNTLTLTKKDNTTVVFTPTFTDTNYYHTPSYSTGLKIATGTGVNDLYVPTGTTNTSVALGNHTHSNYLDKNTEGIESETSLLFFSKSLGTAGTLRVNDDNDYYEGTDNFHSADIDTTYCSKGIQVKNADDPEIDDVTLSFPNASGTLLLKEQLLNLIYPVGSIYLSTTSNFNPNTAFGGTWVKIQEGTFLAAAQTTSAGQEYSVGATGGYKTTNHVFYRPPINGGYGQSAPQNYVADIEWRANNHLLAGGSTALELDKITYTYGGAIDTSSTTTNTEVGFFKYTTDNRPPYLAVVMWKRTA